MTIQTPNVPAPGQIAREEFGARELAVQSETAIAGLAAQARAEIEAWYVMAARNPRSLDDVRQKLLKECRRPSFAKVARYSLSFGGKPVAGPSIRFAEAARRAYGNIQTAARTIYDDPMKRIVRVVVVDLEAGLPDAKDVTITKTVERRKLKDGEIPLSIRHNAQGDTLYIVPASDIDLRAKEGGEVSRAKRNLILGMLPGDLIEEALREVLATIADRFAKDPDASRKELVDAFAAFGVYAKDLEEHLGHDLDHLSPDEGAELWGLHDSMRSGDVRWKDVVAEREAEEKPKPTAAPEKPKRGVAGAKQALKEQTAPAPAPAVQAPPPAAPASSYENKDPIQPGTLATLLARAEAAGVKGDAQVAAAVNLALGDVGITTLDQVTDGEAKQTIEQFEIEARKRQKKTP